MTFPFPSFSRKVLTEGPKTRWLFSGYNASNKFMAHVVTAAGFGTGYSLSSPGSAPRGICVTAAADAAVAGDFSSGLCGAPFTPGTGWGTAYSTSSGWPGGYGNHGRVAMHPSDGAVVKGAATSSPYMFGCPFNKVTGFGTAYSAPGTVPAGTIFGCQFTPTGELIVARNDIYAYQFSTVTGYGTAYSAASRSADGESIFVKDAGGGLGVYYTSGGDIKFTPFDPATGFGTEVNGAGSIYSGSGLSVCVDPQNANAFVVSTTSPYIYGAPLTAGVAGTKYSNPSAVFDAAPTGSASVCSPVNGGVFFAGGNNSSITQAVAVGGIAYTSGVGFGSKFTAPASKGGSVGEPRALGVAAGISSP